MYAIIESGTKQYTVKPGDILTVERPGLPVKVLFAADGDKVHVGKPYLEGASVECEVLEEFKGPKLLAFKFRRRKASKSIRGHRQKLVKLQVKEIKVNNG